jgi:hypothetical protein
MDGNHTFHLVDIDNNTEAKKMLAEFENEFAQKVGGEVVLVAYKRDGNEGEWN